MKRYRICAFDFDARANFLNQSTEGWSEQAKAQIKQIEQEIINEFGIINKEAKINRFKEIGPKPLSILSYHNHLLSQIRESYVQGAFYPTLTGTCALGERILNNLILDLRENYIRAEKSNIHPCNDCKKFNILKSKGLIKLEVDIFTCKSCSNWNLMISSLVKWKVFNSEVGSLFRRLLKKRQISIHFNKKVIANLKKESLESIKILQEIVQKLFPAFGGDYFIPVKGEPFLKKELESKPFFKKYYIPNSYLVSPFHKVKQIIPHFIIQDIKKVEDKEISDKEFIKLREEFLEKKTPKK